MSWNIAQPGMAPQFNRGALKRRLDRGKKQKDYVSGARGNDSMTQNPSGKAYPGLRKGNKGGGF